MDLARHGSLVMRVWPRIGTLAASLPPHQYSCIHALLLQDTRGTYSCPTISCIHVTGQLAKGRGQKAQVPLCKPALFQCSAASSHSQQSPLGFVPPGEYATIRPVSAMEGQSTTYTYSPLDKSRRQIRLLHLLPAHESSDNAKDGSKVSTEAVKKNLKDICCTFSLASLDNHIEYEALSYAWGDAKSQQTVYIHGHTFPVTKNLYDTLLHLRQTKQRILWVDALCINQADVAERANQVLQMGSVYAQARTVVVYLGEWKSSAIAFRLIEALGDDPMKHHYDASWTQKVLQSFSLELSPETASALLIEFFSLPWWSRVWTVQEYALAQTILFQSGHHVLHGESLDNMEHSFLDHKRCCARGGVSAAWWLTQNPELPGHLDKGAVIMTIRSTISERKRCDLSLILGVHARESSNPLDKIYGLLALVPTNFQARIHPNYSLPHSIVYTESTLAWISSTGTLDILSFVDRKIRLGSEMPSYVPDFQVKNIEQYNKRLLARFDTLKIFCASHTSVPVVSAIQSLQISTQAVFIDTVLQTVTKETFYQWLDEPPQNDIVDSRPSLSRYSTPTKALWQHLCGGLMIDFDTATNTANYRVVEDSDYITFQKGRKSGSATIPTDDTGNSFRLELSEIVKHGRRIAATSSGYLAMIPKAAGPGDHVVLMPGGKVPYIVRKLEETYELSTPDSDSIFTERYEFMGDSYIHGIMFGEAWDEMKLRPIVLT